MPGCGDANLAGSPADPQIQVSYPFFYQLYRNTGYVDIGCFCFQGSGFRVQGSRFKVQDSRFKVQGSRFMVHGSWFMVHGSWFMVHGKKLCEELYAVNFKLSTYLIFINLT
jgi:hypothetical protein